MVYFPGMKKTVHYLITTFLVFGFGFIPAPAPLTQFGMNILGIFIGAVYGWSTINILWPSILALAALGVSVGMNTMFTVAFGNSVVPLLLVLFVFLGLLDEYKVTSLIAKFFVFNKLTNGRTYVLIYLMMVGAFALGPINPYVGIFLFIAFARSMLNSCGVPMPSKLSMFMCLGFALASMLGQIAVPFLSTAIMLNNVFIMMTGNELPYASYMLFMIPLDLFVFFVYILIMKFVFRVDVSKLKNVTPAAFGEMGENTAVSTEQKVSLILVAAFLVLAILMCVLPKTLALTEILNKFGLFGIIAILIAIALIFPGGETIFFDYAKIAKNSINYDVVFLSGFIMAISNYMSSPDTGIQSFISGLFMPLAQFPTIVFVLLILTATAIVTNFMNNTVLIIVVMPIIASFAAAMNFSSTGPIMVLFIVANFALFTPGASPFAAIAFSQHDMVETGALMRYALITFAILLVITLAVGLPYSTLIF